MKAPLAAYGLKPGSKRYPDEIAPQPRRLSGLLSLSIRQGASHRYRLRRRSAPCHPRAPCTAQTSWPLRIAAHQTAAGRCRSEQRHGGRRTAKGNSKPAIRAKCGVRRQPLVVAFQVQEGRLRTEVGVWKAFWGENTGPEFGWQQVRA